MDEKTYLRKIRRIVKYWIDVKCPKCGGKVRESPLMCSDYSFKCIECGFELAYNHNYSYIQEIDNLAKKGLEL